MKQYLLEEFEIKLILILQNKKRIYLNVSFKVT